METVLLTKLFREYYNETPTQINPLKGDGSDRRVYRMSNAYRSVIGVAGDHRAENEAFIYFSNHFRRHNLPVPTIYVTDLEAGIYIEEDLGLYTLFEWMMPIREKKGFCQEILEFYKKALSWLPSFQISAGRTLSYVYCYQHAAFDHDSMVWDLQYFFHRFLNIFLKNDLNKSEIFRDFTTLVHHLLQVDSDYFLYRDFQSRNVMVRDGEPYFIDYQSGRRGALQYDVASLLYDAKANIPEEIRLELLDHYLEEANKVARIDRVDFLRFFYSFALIRIMQAFGAYGYLSAVKGKRNFLKSVPFAVKNLEIMLQKAEILDDLPALRNVFTNMIEDESLRKF